MILSSHSVFNCKCLIMEIQIKSIPKKVKLYFNIFTLNFFFIFRFRVLCCFVTKLLFLIVTIIFFKTSIASGLSTTGTYFHRCFSLKINLFCLLAPNFISKGFFLYLFLKLISKVHTTLIFNSFPSSICLAHNLSLLFHAFLAFSFTSMFSPIMSFMIIYQENTVFIFHLYIEILDINLFSINIDHF